MPTYRYAQAFPAALSVQNLTVQLPTAPVSVSQAAPQAYIDVNVAAVSKFDLDEVMANAGYVFVATDPLTTPKVNAQGAFLGSDLDSIGFGVAPNATISYDLANAIAVLGGAAGVAWRCMMPLQSKNYGIAGFTVSRYDLRGGAGTTVGAVAAVLRTFTIDPLTTFWFDARVCARGSTGAIHATYGRRVMAHREGAAPSLGAVDSYWTSTQGGAPTCTWTLSGNTLQLVATGIAGATIAWAATIEHQLVSTSV